jgi:CBS domain-containing protein
MAGLGERAVPVVDADRKLVGVVGLKDLADLFSKPKEKFGRQGRASEKDPVKVEIGSIMRPPVAVRPDSTLAKALDSMASSGISTIVVEEDGEPVGILTTADVVELAARFRPRDGLLVQISGLEEQPDVYEQIYGVIQKAMRRIGEIVTPRLLNLHIVQYKAEGDKSKWSIRARFATEHGMYHFKHFDWDLFKTLEGLLDQIEAHIKKEKDRRIAERRPHRGS